MPVIFIPKFKEDDIMATAKKLPSGSWRCQIYSHTEEIKQPDGTVKKKRIYKSFTCDVQGAKGKRLCEQMAAEWAANKEGNSSGEAMKLSEAMDKYISERESVLSPRTIISYKQFKRDIPDNLTEKELHSISQSDIQNYINSLSVKKSPKTVRNYNGFISSVMKRFLPSVSYSISLPKKVRPDLYVPTDKDVSRLIQAVRGTDLELPVLLAAFGPMRRGEICALRAEDISGNVVHVHRNMVITENKEWIEKSPKSYAGDRYIEFPDFVAAKWKGKTGQLVEITPDVITNRFHRVLKRNNLPEFRFHDLRHYSASIQHSLGVPDSYIMQRGGWGNDGVLKAVYRHAMEDKAKEMSRIANDHFAEICNTRIAK